jgi:serine/threonine protein kinase/DNA-binding XRE family transcriptional regulator/chemotaxis protein histidine kinase CheA
MQEIPFGQQVRERRRALDLTQEELARRVACAAITVRRIEAGTMRASQQIAERLAAALAVPQDQRAAFVRAARAVVADGREPVVTPRTPQLVLSEVGQVDLNGRMIRGYQLGEQLGSGGFGAVYRAMQPLVEREVAIKIILPNFADQPDFIRRFETEAQLVARLEHPHIVPLYDYWREPGVAYLVMRLMRGGSLHGLLRQGPLSLTRISTVVGQLGAALKVAHRAGVVHRDLKPANVLLDDEQNAYLADFGIAKDLHRPAEMSFAGAFVGSPAYASPEQIRAEAITPQTDIYALGVMLYELLTGQKPFVGPTPASYLEQHLNATVPALASNRADLPPDLDQIIRRATAKLPGARYNDITDLVAEVQACIGGADRDIQQADQQAVRSYRSAAPTPTLILDLEAGDNPYQGLRPFDEATAATFFGRETLVQQLLGRLGETGELARFLAVIGPSGSGKSSVVRAGLLPALRNGALPGSEQWYIVQMLPGPQPLEQLALALHRVAPAGVEADDLLALLKSDERGLLRASRLVLPNDPAVELVLLIDQFEEIFTHIQDEQLRISILDSLVTAILDSRSRLRIIITLRADFIDRLLHYVDLGELVRQRGELVLPLTSDEIERAIVGPARWAGLTLDDGLVAMLVADVSAQPGLLPLLQHTLSELFTRREGRHLKKSAYNEVGGVVGALVHSAEALYGRLNDAEQEQAHQLFLRLVTPGEGIEDTRRRARLSELSTTKSPKSTKQARAEADEVLEQFGAARLLTFDRDQVSREPTVEVTHEALLRSWPRLRSWIDDAREELRVARRLAQAAAEWSASGHDSSYLASGARLEQFAAFTTITLTAQERAFLDASLDDRDRQIAAEKERQERELAQALALAEEQRQRAEAAGAAADASQQATKAQRRVAQSLRVLASALTIFLLVVGGLALFAIGQQREAERQALQANVRAWSAASLNNLAVDPERSLLLSLQAANATFERDRTLLPEAEDALRRSIQAAKVKYRLQLPEGTVYAIGIWSRNCSMCGIVPLRPKFSLQQPRRKVPGQALAPMASSLQPVAIFLQAMVRQRSLQRISMIWQAVRCAMNYRCLCHSLAPMAAK